MATWAAEDAKARFDELLATCVEQGPQIVSANGADAAVLVPMRDWRPTSKQPPKYRDIKEWLLAPEARADLDIPPRTDITLRPVADFD